MFAITRSPALACAPRRISLLDRITRARALWRSRKALATLSAAQRADVGLTRDEATAEAARPFWDAPQHWRG